jgi:hypothetical protein
LTLRKANASGTAASEITIARAVRAGRPHSFRRSSICACRLFWYLVFVRAELRALVSLYAEDGRCQSKLATQQSAAGRLAVLSFG